MERRITAALVGCGRMGAFTSEGVRRFAPPCWFPLSHAEAIRAHSGLELAAVVDQTEDAWRRAADAYGVTRGYTDYPRMLAEVRPELLAVATRTPGRADIILAGLAAGVRAFHVEKPLCNSVRELVAIEAAFAQPDRFLTLGTVRRHFPIYRQARAIVESGVLGPLKEIRVNLGAGALYWTHPHSVDLVLFAARTRRLEAVQARFSNLAMPNPAVVSSDPALDWATLHFADGVTGHIGRAPGCDLVLACAAGQVVVESDGRALRIAKPRGDDPYLTWEEATPAPASGPQGTFGPIAQLVQCLRGDAVARAENQLLRTDIFLGHLRNSGLLGLGDAVADLTIEARTGNNAA
jgi:scyllo-inositol 2-dehydrogenase (NAD+)